MAKLYEHMLIIYQVAVTMGGCVYRMCYGYTLLLFLLCNTSQVNSQVSLSNNNYIVRKT